MFIDEIIIPEIKDGKVVKNTYRYCRICGSINVKISSKNKEYCGDICWKNDIYKKSNADIMFDRCGGDMCCEY